jgi:hypothetical protein
MYIRADKKHEYKSQLGTNGITQKSINSYSTFQFTDKRPEALNQMKLQEIAKNSPKVKQLKTFQEMANKSLAPIQMQRLKSNDITVKSLTDRNVGVLQLKTVTVRNGTNAYDSGWVQSETQSTGVDDGPAAEAQRVAGIAGGNWVGGHMVNDRLGGTGGFSNIIPITSTMNNQHHAIENAAQAKVGIGLGNKEVRYYMNIPSRYDYTWANGDKVNNLPNQFQQSYDWRTKATGAAAAGPTTTVNGALLDMTL